MAIKIQTIVDHLNAHFKPAYQEDWDNCGLLVGESNEECTGVLVALDLTLEVIEEAIGMKANMIVTHHPIMYSGIRRITPANQEGQMIMLMLRHGICHYAAHTDLDNMRDGVSGILAQKLGVEHTQVLRPMEGVLRKLVTYCPTAHAEHLRQILFKAGAGECTAGRLTSEGLAEEYTGCSFNTHGTGTFLPGQSTNPFCGDKGTMHHEEEERIELIYERHRERKIISKLLEAHPYEQPAYDIIQLRNLSNQIGGGAIGTLAEPMPLQDFLKRVSEVCHIPCIRTSAPCRQTVRKIALCGGSGSFMIGDAKGLGADIYLTGDLKYHDFQQAEGKIVLAEIGHYESEQFAQELLIESVRQLMPDARLSQSHGGFIYYNTYPINDKEENKQKINN